MILLSFQHCQKKYKDSMESYVKSYLGSPLSKINTFFNGVKLKLDTGVPHQEVAGSLCFNKTII